MTQRKPVMCGYQLISASALPSLCARSVEINLNLTTVNINLYLT